MVENGCEYEYKIPPKRGVIFVIFNEFGQILLELRRQRRDPFRGFFLIPGGGIEPGENVESTTIREVKEECSIDVQKLQKIGEISTLEGNGYTNTRDLVVIESYLGGVINVENKNIHLWASPQKARLICKHPVTIEALDKLDRYLSTRK